MTIHIRYIPDQLMSASFNMAADNFLLQQCSDSETVFVRTYTWNCPSITIGMIQDPETVLDMAAIERDGVAWIQRPTGGRPVMHYQDCTYSCVFSHKLHSMGKTVKETYAIISDCLKSALGTIGIVSSSHDSDLLFNELKRQQKLPCFLTPNRDEIMVDGKKLIGSAQRRTRDGVLQHGSIPISNAYLQLPCYLNIDESERGTQMELLKKKTMHLSAINPNITFSLIASAIAAGFSNTLDCSIVNLPWSSFELANIKEIMTSDIIEMNNS
jgi:lipoate-protein ligase A